MSLKAWVTGSRGFVGSHLVDSLLIRRHHVLRITNVYPPVSGMLYVNYGSRESIRYGIDRYGLPDVVFHLGWGEMSDPRSLVHVNQNVSNTANLAEELFASGLRKMLFVGSADEYGSREGSLSEDMPPIGRLTNYAKGKLAAGHFGMESASRHGKVFIHVRLFYTFGAVTRASALISQLYKSYYESRPLELTSCEQFRDYIYVSEAAEGLARISQGESSSLVNLGSGKNIQLRQLVQMFWSHLGGDPGLLKFGSRERPDYEAVQPPCYANLEKLVKMTDWRPVITIKEGISKTVDEFRRRGLRDR